MRIKRKQGYFSISAVAKMFSVHQQTIRLYEKQGLLCPKRSEGNTRLFSEDDIDRLEEIIYLTHELGINIAGVEMIFKLKKQIQKLQKDMNHAFEDTQKELDRQAQNAQSMVHKNAKSLLSLKNKTMGQIEQREPELEQIMTVDTEKSWKIDYEE